MMHKPLVLVPNEYMHGVNNNGDLTVHGGADGNDRFLTVSIVATGGVVHRPRELGPSLGAAEDRQRWCL